MWWWWSAGTAEEDPGTTVDIVPGLWSGGWRWGDPDAPFGDGTDFYWGAVSAATGRTGRPRLAVAINGVWVANVLQEAEWSLGRSDWLSTLAPTTASFRFVGVPAATVNDSVVVGLMSDAAEYHSDALWVGRVDAIGDAEEIDGQVYGSISATDVVGILGQAESPTSIAAGHTLKSLVQTLAASAGVPLKVDTDSLATLPTLTAASDLSGTLLGLINRAERSSNALLFLRGSGRLYAARRDRTNTSSVRVIDLDGDDSPSAWRKSTSRQGLITRWKLGGNDGGWSTDTSSPNLEVYGDQTYSAEDLLVADPTPYEDLIAADVLSTPRAILTDAPFPIRDMAQDMLTINPLDRVSRDGQTWQVMSVSHRVAPVKREDGHFSAWGDWTVTISADATQEALVGAAEPGPVTPPGEHEVTSTFVSSKSMYVYKVGSTEAGDATSEWLSVGYDSGVRQRALIEFPIVWPAGFQEVVGAKLRIRTFHFPDDGLYGSHPKIRIMRNTETWAENTGTKWPGPSATSYGNRYVDVPRTNSAWVEVSIPNIARFWHEENTGLVIRAADETDPDRRCAFHSDDSDSIHRPQLILTCRVIT